MGMRRYLLVLDMDLLAADEKFDLEPVNYLVALEEQGPCEAVVLSLANTAQTRLPATELLLGAQSGKFPVAPRPSYNVGAAAEHRMNLAVQHLTVIGCQASGFIGDEESLVKAVMSEVRGRDFTAVLLVNGHPRGSSLSRWLHLDPISQLRRRLGQRLIVFPLGPDALHPFLPS
jgi:hypothetical protein